MKFYSFSFKTEAIWSMVFNLAGLAVGAIAFLLIYLMRSLL
jgi:hypothetical protein